MTSEQQIGELKNSLASHQGEGVLVVVREWEKLGWDMPKEMTPYGFAERLYLGVATAPFLKQTPGLFGDLTVCTSYHALSRNWLRRHQIQLEEGPITDWKLACHYLGKPLGPKPGRKLHAWGGPVDDLDEFGWSRRLAVEIIAGDAKITDWFVELARYGNMPKYERDLIESVDAESSLAKKKYAESLKENRLDINLLIGYQRMRSALSLVAAALPVELDSRITSEITQKKMNILDQIDELLKQEEKLRSQLEKALGVKLPRISFPLEGGDYEKEVGEDEKDLRMIKAYHIKEEERKLQAQIKGKIKEAVSWGMHRQPWVVTREPVPGKKIETDVPVLIRNLVHYYEIFPNRIEELSS